MLSPAARAAISMRQTSPSAAIRNSACEIPLANSSRARIAAVGLEHGRARGLGNVRVRRAVAHLDEELAAALRRALAGDRGEDDAAVLAERLDRDLVAAHEPFDEQRLAVVVVVERGEQLRAVVDAHDARAGVAPGRLQHGREDVPRRGRSRRAVGAMNSERGLQSREVAALQELVAADAARAQPGRRQPEEVGDERRRRHEVLAEGEHGADVVPRLPGDDLLEDVLVAVAVAPGELDDRRERMVADARGGPRRSAP